MEELISVIIPIYNTEIYIENCIDSIINQTYSNLQIILINDGSTDNSGEICNSYSDRDKRIEVIHLQKNYGVYFARNQGIKKVRGNYISFIDSDDIIDKKYFETLYQSLKTNNSELAICNLKEFNIKENYNFTNLPKCRNCNIEILNQSQLINCLFSIKNFMGIGGKLYKKKIINDNYFKNYSNAEDFEFNSRVYLNVKKICWVKNELYYYLQRSNSSSQKKNIISKVSEINALLEAYYNVIKINNSYKKIGLDRVIKVYCNNMIHSENSDKKILSKELKNIKKRLKGEIVGFYGLSIFKRFIYLLCILKPHIYQIITHNYKYIKHDYLLLLK